MKIEVWSDYVCPYCYIGKRSLEYAIEEFAHKDKIVIEYKSYELDPDTIEVIGRPINDQMSIQAKEVGLNYNFDQMKHTNSFDAHRLTRLAIKEGKGNDIVERLFQGHFIEGKSINDHADLIEIAVKSGLQYDKVETLLQSCKYTSHVRDDEDQAVQMGVEGVPFFVFNETHALSGAQPVRVMKEVLQQVWEEELNQGIEHIRPTNSKASYCTDEGCQLEE